MHNVVGPPVPVKAKAVLIDPTSMTVVWMNESAAHDAPGEPGAMDSGTPVSDAVPMADLLGVQDAARTVAETGVARHLQADLVSTARGSVAIVASIYRLPDGMLLLLIENAWQAEHTRKDATASHRTRRSR